MKTAAQKPLKKAEGVTLQPVQASSTSLAEALVAHGLLAEIDLEIERQSHKPTALNRSGSKGLARNLAGLCCACPSII